MSRRHSPRALDEPDTTPEAVIDRLLYLLCVRFGFCLPPDANADLRANPPRGPEAFTDKVIAVEGLDPATFDSTMRKQMIELARAEAGSIL